MESELYSQFLLAKSEYMKKINPKDITVTESLNLSQEMIDKYRSSFVLKYKPNNNNHHKHKVLKNWLTKFMKEVYFLEYARTNHNKYLPESFFEKVYNQIKDWNPDITYSCPISLYSDVLFQPDCKLRFNLNFDTMQYGKFDFYRFAMNLTDQIELTKHCLRLLKYNNNLWHEKILSSTNDHDWDFMGKDSNYIDQIQYSNFGQLYDFEYDVYEYMLVNNMWPDHQAYIEHYKKIPKPATMGMDSALMDTIKRIAYNLTGKADYFEEEWDAGFIFLNRTYTNNTDYNDPFDQGGKYLDYPLLNISLGCSSIVLLEVSKDCFPIGFVLDSGSMLHLPYNCARWTKKMLTPFQKSFTTQGLTLQESSRIIEDLEVYEQELLTYNSLSAEDRKIVDILRKCRIDLQLRVTKHSWKDVIPYTKENKMKEMQRTHMQDMIKMKLKPLTTISVKNEDEDNENENGGDKLNDIAEEENEAEENVKSRKKSIQSESVENVAKQLIKELETDEPNYSSDK